MNALYKAIAAQIHTALFRKAIATVRNDPKKGIRELKADMRWKTFSQKDREFWTGFFQAIKEGWEDFDLHTTWFDRYVNHSLNLLRKTVRDGHAKQDLLHNLYDSYRSHQELRDLSERDFYLFFAYTACTP
jgi:hypothetical protein